MSAVAQTVSLDPGARSRVRPRRLRLDAFARWPAIAFGLLAAYGMLRWQTLLPHSMRWRCAGLLALGLTVMVLLSLAVGDDRPAAWRQRGRTARRAPAGGAWPAVLVALSLLAALAMVPMAGLPLSWAGHLRVAISLRAIGDGIGSLPGVTVPYIGRAVSTRAVIALGGGMLTVGAAVAFATARRTRGVGHRAVSGLPLVVLASVPSALGRPHLIAVHGLVLLLLLVAFLFWERILRRGVIRATVMVAMAALAAVPISGALDGTPWFSLSRLVSALGPPPVERFDWSQTYGPLGAADNGPSETVLRIRARFPAYWKAEDLDVFDGIGWATSPNELSTPLYPQQPRAGFSRAADNRWSQQLTVSVAAMSTSRVVAAGVAGFPVTQGGALQVVPANSPGTWTVEQPLHAGEQYTVEVYTPRPSAPELEHAGLRYPVALTSTELGIELPKRYESSEPTQQVQFAQYGAGESVVGGSGLTVAEDQAMLADSPYAGVYRLAQRLEAGTSSPYDYVLAVLRHLGHGYTYTRHPPVTHYPIPGFLLRTKAGYCQQFAGAMALLLRMGGVPARVAVGFTTGAYDQRSREYVVTNKDAHAWVEVWFPKYGWVSFDPTPAGRRAIAGLPVDSSPAPQAIELGGGVGGTTGTGHTAPGSTAGRGGAAAHPGQRPASMGSVLLWLVVAVLALGAWFGRLTRRPLPSRRRGVAIEVLVAELERAFARCGRPLSANVTLSAVERRVAGGDRQAAAYVARLREARFAAGARIPSGAQRRALRAWLAQGMGPAGRLRALLALPPRRLH